MTTSLPVMDTTFNLFEEIENADAPQSFESLLFLEFFKLHNTSTSLKHAFSRLLAEFDTQYVKLQTKTNKSENSESALTVRTQYTAEFKQVLSEALGFQIDELDSNKLSERDVCNNWKKAHVINVLFKGSCSGTKEMRHTLECEFDAQFKAILTAFQIRMRSIHSEAENISNAWNHSCIYGGIIVHSRKNDQLPRNNFHFYFDSFEETPCDGIELPTEWHITEATSYSNFVLPPIPPLVYMLKPHSSTNPQYKADISQSEFERFMSHFVKNRMIPVVLLEGEKKILLVPMANIDIPIHQLLESRRLQYYTENTQHSFLAYLIGFDSKFKNNHEINFTFDPTKLPQAIKPTVKTQSAQQVLGDEAGKRSSVSAGSPGSVDSDFSATLGRIGGQQQRNASSNQRSTLPIYPVNADQHLFHTNTNQSEDYETATLFKQAPLSQAIRPVTTSINVSKDPRFKSNEIKRKFQELRDEEAKQEMLKRRG